MNTELFEALKLLEKEKGIPVEYMLSQIEKSILVACKVETMMQELRWTQIRESLMFT